MLDFVFSNMIICEYPTHQSRGSPTTHFLDGTVAGTHRDAQERLPKTCHLCGRWERQSSVSVLPAMCVTAQGPMVPSCTSWSISFPDFTAFSDARVASAGIRGGNPSTYTTNLKILPCSSLTCLVRYTDATPRFQIEQHVASRYLPILLLIVSAAVPTPDAAAASRARAGRGRTPARRLGALRRGPPLRYALPAALRPGRAAGTVTRLLSPHPAASPDPPYLGTTLPKKFRTPRQRPRLPAAGWG